MRCRRRRAKLYELRKARETRRRGRFSLWEQPKVRTYFIVRVLAHYITLHNTVAGVYNLHKRAHKRFSVFLKFNMKAEWGMAIYFD